MRVVLTQHGHAQPIRVSNFKTSITGFDSMSSQAVLVEMTKTDCPAHLDITATSNKKIRVGSTELITSTIAQPKNVNDNKSVIEPKDAR